MHVNHEPSAHIPVVVEGGWDFFVAQAEAKRLVVFVHGFRGGLKTWLHFPDFPSGREWWAEADLLFVNYDSLRENITGIANHLRKALPAYYPSPHPVTAALMAGERGAQSHYEELLLVGHSLGGVILRRLMCDIAERWRESRGSPRPALLDAQLRLFSPASAGFQPAGALGTLRAAAGIWTAAELVLRRSSAYSDLQPGSEVLKAIRRRTERLAGDPNLSVLRADILWANPDNVVITERYDSDHPDDSAPNSSHASVCKPLASAYETPWDFVEGGAQ